MTTRRLARWTQAALLSVAVGVSGCKSLDISNPNTPDAARAFSDPGAVAGLLTGAFRGWILTHEAADGPLTMTAMADSYTASWNNWNLRYYSSHGFECAQRCGWDNRPTSSFRFQIETLWYGYYSALSSANDVLTAIRKNDVIITDQNTTNLIEAAAVMMQGIVFSQIALNYDQGFIVDDDTDLSNPLTLPFANRSELRDAATAKFDEAITLLGSVTGSTPSAWVGVSSGRTYTAAQMIKLVRTLQAQNLAMFPRTAAENGQVNWGQVATYASNGLSSGTGFDFEFYQDPGFQLFDHVKIWSNAIGLMRVDTRVAAMVTAGPNPAKVHVNPWPAGGNPQPDAFDDRVGNGTWGPSDDFLNEGTIAEDAGAGSDFVWAASASFNPARGNFHQSNLGHIRYSYTTYPGYGLPSEDGSGQVPLYTATYNDLLWAEGLIRSGGSGALAASLINKTRVGRGGLTPLTGAEGTAALLAAVQYEQEVELLGLGHTQFYNRRRVDGLWPMSPRHMPVPAKELGVLARELYTFGGAANPGGISAPSGGANAGVRSVREIWNDLLAARRPTPFGRPRIAQ